mmetsp:Transcript_7200/g.26473  ORF Transcript_7200/g.26473 Transcript_7200/m.26473 type:complete len:590 (-) Transcript_7200:118-1887(-)
MRACVAPTAPARVAPAGTKLVERACRIRCAPVTARPKRGLRNLPATVRCSLAGDTTSTTKQGESLYVDAGDNTLVLQGPDYKGEEAVQVSNEQYQWLKQWYPLSVIEMLDPDRPNKIYLFGRELVAWKDHNDRWNVFDDACPHRLAPLSEGRIEPARDGSGRKELLCAYHAWRLDSAGKCMAIPQAKAADEETLAAAPKACARVHPTREDHGLLWVWGENGPDAMLESLSTAPNIVPQLNDKEGWPLRNTWLQRDLPYGMDSFFENAIDPAHAVVSHHNLVGNRYADPSYFKCVTEKPLDNNAGFRCHLDPPVPPFCNLTPQEQDDVYVAYEYKPPGYMQIDWKHKGGAALCTAHFCIATKPGYCRHITMSCGRGGGGEDSRWFNLNRFTFNQPKWQNHLASPTFIHQDMVLLHQQEKLVEKRRLEEGTKWLQSCYIPLAGDKMDVLYRYWLERNGGIPWAPGIDPRLPPIETDESKLFDCYHSHTKNCPTCRAAMENVNKLRMAFAWLGYVSLAASAGATASALSQGIPVPLGWSAGMAYAAFNFGVLWYCCDWLYHLFREYKYSHADNNPFLRMFAVDVLGFPADEQ